jgi:transposase-like protein
MEADDTTPTTGTSRQRRYSDAEQAEALALLDVNGGDVAATAAQLGYPEQTVRNWAKGLARPHSPELVAEKRAELTRGVEKLTRRILRKVLKVAADDNAPLSLRDGMVSLGIGIDKLRYLNGETTPDVAQIVDERIVRLMELYGKRQPVHVQARDTTPLPAPIEEQTAAPVEQPKEQD